MKEYEIKKELLTSKLKERQKKKKCIARIVPIKSKTPFLWKKLLIYALKYFQALEEF